MSHSEFSPASRRIIYIGLALAIILSLDWTVDNVWYYVSPGTYDTTGSRFALILSLFPVGTLRRIVFLTILGAFFFAAICQLLKAHRTPVAHTPRAKVWTYTLGIFGAVAWMKAFSYLYLDLNRFMQFTGIDNFLRSADAFRPSATAVGTSGDSAILENINVVVEGGVEELTYAVILLSAVILFRVRPWVAVTLVTVLRAVFHLHWESIFSLVFLAPAGVFAAIFVLRFGRIMPVVIGHMIYNVLTLYSDAYVHSPNWFEGFLQSGALPLMTAIGFVLTLVAVRPREALVLERSGGGVEDIHPGRTEVASSESSGT